MPPRAVPPTGSLTGVLPVKRPNPGAPKPPGINCVAAADQAKPASATGEQGLAAWFETAADDGGPLSSLRIAAC